jgi:hypothetical protein
VEELRLGRWQKKWKKLSIKIKVEKEMHVAVSKISRQTSRPVPMSD